MASPIFAQLGFSQGILNDELYAALLIVIALATMSPPFLLKWFYGMEEQPQLGVSYVIKPAIFPDYTPKG